jgi:uncharacterized DUF497 family protein
MPVKRLSRAEAADLVRHCLSAGRVIPGKHFREELANEGLDILDAHHVLRKGNIFQEPEPDIRSGDWKYRMVGTDLEGKPLAVVFCFRDESTGFLITIFSTRR